MTYDPSYWLAEQIKALRKQISDLAALPALFNASSDGTNGWLKIFANAISGRPALEFHYTGGGGDILAQMYQDTGGNIRITGGLQVSGTKNFVMAHPTEPGWVLRHASTESPVNGVEYWGEAVLDSLGTVTVKLPLYFEALTKVANRVVHLTPIGTPAALAYTRIVDGTFTVTGPADAEFSWLVKAERAPQVGDWPIDFLAEEEGHVEPPPETEDIRPVKPSSPMVDDPGAVPWVDPTPVTPDPAPAETP